MAINEIPLPSVTEVALQRDKEILYSAVGLVQKGRTFAQNAAAGPNSDGILPSGTVVGQLNSGKWAEYIDDSVPGEDEVQTLTVSGSGLESWTATFEGQTTVSLADDATGEDVQAALEELSTIGEGNVEVTGAAGGPWVVTFVNALGSQDVAAITTTPTGGTGSVGVVETNKGVEGDPASMQATGILRNAIDVSSGDVLGNVVLKGMVKYDQLVGFDAAAEADLKARVSVHENYVSF